MTRPVDSLAAAPEPTAPVAPRPPRPVLVEVAAAILIVGGVAGLLGALNASRSLPPGSEWFIILTVALDVGSIAAGVLTRTGRLWILVVNYVAVLGFLDLAAATGGSSLALVLGTSNVAAVVILVATKPWFDAMAEWRSSRPGA